MAFGRELKLSTRAQRSEAKAVIWAEPKTRACNARSSGSHRQRKQIDGLAQRRIYEWTANFSLNLAVALQAT
jgi:hypothetical protein